MLEFSCSQHGERLLGARTRYAISRRCSHPMPSKFIYVRFCAISMFQNVECLQHVTWLCMCMCNFQPQSPLCTGAVTQAAADAAEAQEILQQGYQRRSQAATASNRCSSRSHCLVCVTVHAIQKVRTAAATLLFKCCALLDALRLQAPRCLYSATWRQHGEAVPACHLVHIRVTMRNHVCCAPERL